MGNCLKGETSDDDVSSLVHESESATPDLADTEVSQSELAPPDVCFSSLEVISDDRWTISDSSPSAMSPDLNAGDDTAGLDDKSPSHIDFSDHCEGAVGCLPDLCSTVDLSQCLVDEYSSQSECRECISEREACDQQLSFDETDDSKINKELKLCTTDMYMHHSSKKINIISCDTGLICNNIEFSPDCIHEAECDNLCAFSATPSTSWDIGIVRQNIVQSSDPKFYIWENMVAVPNQLLGTVLIHSHGTSLGYLASPHYGFQTSSRHSSLYDAEPQISEEDKIKLAKRYGLIHHLPCGTFDGSTQTTECVICMIDFSEGDQLRYLPCMHTYHTECIDDWLMRSFTCPSCLEPVDAALLSTYETS